MMQQPKVPAWVRGVAWVSLGVAPIFVTLGYLNSKLEWGASGAALAVYGLVVLRRGRHAVIGPATPVDVV